MIMCYSLLQHSLARYMLLMIWSILAVDGELMRINAQVCHALKAKLPKEIFVGYGRLRRYRRVRRYAFQHANQLK